MRPHTHTIFTQKLVSTLSLTKPFRASQKNTRFLYVGILSAELEDQEKMKISGMEFSETMAQVNQTKMDCFSSNLAAHTIYEYATHSSNVNFEGPGNTLNLRSGINWIIFYVEKKTVITTLFV